MISPAFDDECIHMHANRITLLQASPPQTLQLANCTATPSITWGFGCRITLLLQVQAEGRGGRDAGECVAVVTRENCNVIMSATYFKKINVFGQARGSLTRVAELTAAMEALAIDAARSS